MRDDWMLKTPPSLEGILGRLAFSTSSMSVNSTTNLPFPCWGGESLGKGERAGEGRGEEGRGRGGEGEWGRGGEGGGEGGRREVGRGEGGKGRGRGERGRWGEGKRGIQRV